MRLWIIQYILGLLQFLMGINAWPAVNTAMIQDNGMFKIPQWHCLRYFKHDIHMMRRCRIHRGPLVVRRIKP